MAEMQLKHGCLYYEIQGRGQPLVLIRGLGRSSRYWLDFDQRLASSFQVITFDQRGLGKSSEPLRWWHSIDHMVEDLLALLDHLKIDKAHIFGLSLGGMVAMGFAARYPDRCLSLMVANSSTADYWGFRIHPKAIQDLLLKGPRQGFHRVLLGLLTTPAIVKKQGVKLHQAWDLIRMDEGFPWATIAKQLLCASRFRIRGRLHGEKVPTMIIYGAKDSLVPIGNSLMIHRLIPKSILKPLKDAGHEISIGKEADLMRIIQDFSRTVASKQSVAKSNKVVKVKAAKPQKTAKKLGSLAKSAAHGA